MKSNPALATSKSRTEPPAVARPGVESNRPIVPTPELGIACLMVSMVGMPELGRLLNNRWIQLRAVNKRANRVFSSLRADRRSKIALK